MGNTLNIDPQEIAKFTQLSKDWWDTTGPLRTLHELNPVRLQFVTDQIDLTHKTVLDVGCGGGIFAEALAQAGAIVTAIDMDAAALETAKAHAITHEVNIDYRLQMVETLAATDTQQFDLITCMEMLEHVPHPEQIIAACARLLKPEGLLFVSTLNRHPKAYAMAVLGAEYVLNLLPRGTHDYAKFIKPSELATWGRQANLKLMGLQGVSYDPFKHQAHLVDDVKVNYMAYFKAGL